MGVKKDVGYDLSLKARQRDGEISKINFQLVDKNGKILGETTIDPDGEKWEKYETSFNATTTEAKAMLKITFEGKGTIDLDMVSLFPQDTWKGRKKGMRKDLVQL